MVPHHVLIRCQERLFDAADAHKPTIVLGQTGVNTEMTVSLATHFSLFTRWCSSLPAAARDHLVGAYFTQQQPESDAAIKQDCDPCLSERDRTIDVDLKKCYPHSPHQVYKVKEVP